MNNSGLFPSICATMTFYQMITELNEIWKIWQTVDCVSNSVIFDGCFCVQRFSLSRWLQTKTTVFCCTRRTMILWQLSFIRDTYVLFTTSPTTHQPLCTGRPHKTEKLSFTFLEFTFTYLNHYEGQVYACLKYLWENKDSSTILSLLSR